jgi:hypothetical protein
MPCIDFSNLSTKENTMKKLFAAMLLAAPFMLTTAYAATAQQSKMTTCNKDAGERKGDERKAFMKECLSAKPAADKPKVSDAQKAQQDKMKTCNADAKGKKGDERKKFMSACLKKG